jgi:hypothetical protein
LQAAAQDSEDGNFIEVLNKIDIEDANKSKNLISAAAFGDAGCDPSRNIKFLNDKGYTDLIWMNRRNIKGENYFSWIENKSPTGKDI